MVQIPGWARYGWLKAAFSTRDGGATSVYGAEGEQNLGWTAEDHPVVVASNRRGLVEAVAGQQGVELVTLRQVHGAMVQVVRPEDGPLSTAEGRAVLEGDGLVTGADGLMLGVQTADCVPVLVADVRTRAVGAFHAGWRGTVAGVVRVGVETMAREFGSRAEDLIAAIGPSIGPCCFEVGDEVAAAFAGELVSRGEEAKRHVDLWEANRRQLITAGLRAEAITVVGECTACSRTEAGRRKYFSHRAERGVTGRMLSVIGVFGG
jgi:YfiH family protein